MDAEAQAAWLYIDLSVILTVLTLPSHIDKQGNADTTADTGAKLKKNFNFGSDDISRHETYDYEGIKIQNLSDWLLKIE